MAKAIKLSYSEQDLENNSTLFDTAELLLTMGATVNADWSTFTLSFMWEYSINQSIFAFVDQNPCFIKMVKADWEWDVYDWLDWRTIIDDLTWEEIVLTFWQRKAKNFSDPYDDWSFVYIPSDVIWKEINWQQLSIFISNGCELMSIQAYKDMLPVDDTI